MGIEEIFTFLFAKYAISSASKKNFTETNFCFLSFLSILKPFNPDWVSPLKFFVIKVQITKLTYLLIKYLEI